MFERMEFFRMPTTKMFMIWLTLMSIVSWSPTTATIERSLSPNSAAMDRSPFVKEFYEINLNESAVACPSSFNSLSPPLEIEIFRPDSDGLAAVAVAAADSLRFKFTLISSSSSSPDTKQDEESEQHIFYNSAPIFRMDQRTGILLMNLKQAFARSHRYYVIKIIAYDELISRWQTVLDVRLSEKLLKKCDQDRDANNQAMVLKTKLKLLFADSFQSYDFNKLFQNTNNNNKNDQGDDSAASDQSDEEAIYLSEDLLVGSFICYVLVQSNLDLKLVGPDSATFRLERVHFGSTSFLSFDDETNTNIHPIINLYMLKLDKELDRESEPLYRLDIALYKETESLDVLETKRLNVIVADVNDNEPKFERLAYKYEIVENNPANVSVGLVKALDKDLNENGTIEYFFPSGSLISYNSTGGAESGRDPTSLMELNASTGELRIRSSLDREVYSRHQLEVCARDMGNRVQLVSKLCARIELSLLDVNDNRPQFYVFFDDESTSITVDNNNNSSNSNSSQTTRNSNSLRTSRVLDFYVEENCTENTFVAWLKAFDTDAGENSTIVYTLEPVIRNASFSLSSSTTINSTATAIPFWIDPYGIVRNSRRIRLIDDEKSRSESQSSKSNVYLTRQRTFLVKVTATDSSKDPRNRLSTTIELNLRVLKKSDRNEPSVRISTSQNETIFYINRRQHTYNTSQPITRLVVTDTTNSDSTTSTGGGDSSYQSLYSFQMIPLIESSFEYGENCSQSEIIKYFRLNKQGEIYLANYLLNASSSAPSAMTSSESGGRTRMRSKNGPIGGQSLLSLNMICFVNIRVLDLRNPFKLTSSKELVFIIYDVDNKSLDDLIKLKFLKKITFIKNKHLQMSKSGGSSAAISALRNLYGNKNNVAFLGGLPFGSSSASSPIYSISSAVAAAAASFNYSEDEMRKFAASFALDKLNQSLIAAAAAAAASSSSSSGLTATSSSTSYSIFLFVCIVLSLSVVSILLGFRLFVNFSHKRRQRSALNALLSRLSQASAAKLESSTATTTSITNTNVPVMTTTTTTSQIARGKGATGAGSTFKLLLKDLNWFRIKHFTIKIPRKFLRKSTILSKISAQQQKQQQHPKLTESSSSSSTSSSTSCDSTQFKEIAYQNKYMSGYLIKNQLLTNENDGIYKGPTTTTTTETTAVEKRWMSDESATSDSLSHIYSNVNVKIKAAAAKAATSIVATNQRLASVTREGGGDDDTTGKDAFSTASAALDRKSSIDTTRGGGGGANSDSSAIYSLPCLHFSASGGGGGGHHATNSTSNMKSSSAMATVNSSQSQCSGGNNNNNNNNKQAHNLLINESANSFINKSLSVAASGRKMSYGIYQVANQVLIDYDDDEDDDDADDDDDGEAFNTDNSARHNGHRREDEVMNNSSSASVLDDEFIGCSIKSNKNPTITTTTTIPVSHEKTTDKTERTVNIPVITTSKDETNMTMSAGFKANEDELKNETYVHTSALNEKSRRTTPVEVNYITIDNLDNKNENKNTIMTNPKKAYFSSFV